MSKYSYTGFITSLKTAFGARGLAAAKIFLSGSLICCVYSGAYAAGITSAQSGLWSAVSTWDSGTVPTAVDSVTVNAGHIVTVDVMTAVSNGALIRGTVKASRVASSSWTLVGGDLNVNAGGTLDYGSEADTIPTAINAYLVLSSGTFAGQYGLIVNNGGSFTVRGSTKTPYSYASQSITTSDTSLTVYGSTSTDGWQAGDIITIGPTSGYGTATTSSRTITSVTGGPLYTVAWAGGPLPEARILAATSPIIVANLTRNVLVRSSGAVAGLTYTGSNSAYIRNLAQNAAGFVLAYGEFAYLGSVIDGKLGITFDGALTRGAISSSTIRNGYMGIRINDSTYSTFTVNNIYANEWSGIELMGASNNVLIGNNSCSNLRDGIILSNSDNNTLTGNHSYSNTSYPGSGITLGASDNNTLLGNNAFSNTGVGISNTKSGNSPSNNNVLAGNNAYSNRGNGIEIISSFNNTVSLNNSFYNSDSGIYLYDTHSNSLTGNNVYSNALSGISSNGIGDYDRLTGNNSYSNTGDGIFLGSSYNILTDNNSYSNSGSGILLWNDYNTLFGNNSYSNSGYGIFLQYDSPDTVFVGGNLGYDGAGVSRPNTTGEIHLGPRLNVSSSLVLKGARVNPAAGISTAGLTTAGAHILSYNQDYSTGTARIWGNYQLAGSTFTLDYAARLYASTNTAPLNSGYGITHTITGVVTKDADTLSEFITVIHVGANSWQVSGSSSGFIGAFTCAPNTSCAFAHARLDFTLNTSYANGLSDSMSFVTIAASDDANLRKSLLFGPAAPAFNQGRSKLEASSTGGVVLRGKTDGTADTLVDRLDSASTYYTFVDSGAFTAAFASFANADSAGIQLSGTAGVSLSSSTFDFLGFASGANAYITLRDLTSNVTFHNVAFGLSRPSAGYDSAYNLRTEGADSGLAVLFRKSVASLGQLWGEDYDYDPNARVSWSDTLPPPGSPLIASVYLTSVTVTYSLAAGANAYVVDASTASNFTGTLYSSSTPDTALTALSPGGLSPDTAYYLRAGALWGAATSYAYIVPSSTRTLALGQPGLPAGTVLGVSSISWNWAAAANVTGYKVFQASSPATLIASTAAAPFFQADLATNTAYGVVVAGVNGGNQGPLSASATVYTLAAPPTGFALVQVDISSVTVSWAANTNPSGTTTYRVDRWTAGGSTTSVTVSVDSAALTGLTANTDYFFTVQALNGDGVLAPSGLILSTMTDSAPPGSPVISGVYVSSIMVTYGLVAGADGYVVDASTAPDFTGSLYSSSTLNASLTALSPGGLSLYTTYYLRAGALWGTTTSYAFTSPASTMTPTAPPGSPAISGVYVTSITVTYDLVAGANGYVVDASTASGFTGTLYSSSTLNAALAALSPGGLSPATTYYLRAGALWAAATNYAYTAPASTVTLALGRPGTPAGTVLGVSSISWTWAAAANAAGYKVYQASSPATLIASTAAAPYFQTDLATNTAYGVVVAGVNGGNQGPLSASATVYTLAAPPTGFALVQVDVSSITVSWAANTNPSGTTTYRVDRWTAGGSTTSMTVSIDSAALTGLSGGTTYFFTVQARNGDGVLTPSGIVLSTMIPVAIGNIGSDGGDILFNPPSGPVIVDIPPGAFGEIVAVTVRSPASFPSAASPAARLTDVGVGIEITLDKAIQPARDVDISISYQNATLPPGTDESRLILARYDSGRNVWIPLVSTPDPTGNKVIARTGHFSIFQIMQASPSGTVSTAKAFPNPFRPSQGHTAMTFAALPANAGLKIYTLTGQLVKSLTADAVGMATWDVTNESGEKAASGVYFVFAEGAGGKRTFKVLVQR